MLHRIAPTNVKAQVMSAALELVAKSKPLYNPDDSHEVIVFNPSIRGETDRLAYRFRKIV